MSELVLCDDSDIEVAAELDITLAPGPPSCKCTGACKTAGVSVKRWAMAAIHQGANADQQSVPYKWRKKLFTWKTLEGE